MAVFWGLVPARVGAIVVGVYCVAVGLSIALMEKPVGPPPLESALDWSLAALGVAALVGVWRRSAAALNACSALKFLRAVAVFVLHLVNWYSRGHDWLVPLVFLFVNVYLSWILQEYASEIEGPGVAQD